MNQKEHNALFYIHGQLKYTYRLLEAEYPARFGRHSAAERVLNELHVMITEINRQLQANYAEVEANVDSEN